MARSKKKVKGPKTKKFWAILYSSIGGGIFAIILVLLILYMVLNTEPLEYTFADFTDIKINYNELPNILEDSDGDYNTVFVFVYDDSFVEDEPDCDTDETEYAEYEEYVEAQSELGTLVDMIDEANEEDASAQLGIFVMNGSLSSNTGIFGTTDDDDDTTESDYNPEGLSAPCLLSYTVGAGDSELTYASETSDDYEEIDGLDASGKEVEYGLSGGGTAKSVTTVIQECQDYIEFNFLDD